MAYVAMGILPSEHRKVLIDFDPDELRDLPIVDRLEYAARIEEAKAASRNAFWTAIATAVPIMTTLGLMRLLK